jgi:hypothetical protein
MFNTLAKLQRSGALNLYQMKGMKAMNQRQPPYFARKFFLKDEVPVKAVRGQSVALCCGVEYSIIHCHIVC